MVRCKYVHRLHTQMMTELASEESSICLLGSLLLSQASMLTLKQEFFLFASSVVEEVKSKRLAHGFPRGCTPTKSNKTKNQSHTHAQTIWVH